MHPNVISVVEKQPAAVAVMSWSGVVATTWTVVESAAGAYIAGGRIPATYPAETAPRPLSGALAHAAGLFSAAPAAGIECRSKVIDVSGLDPVPGEPLREAMGLMRAQGVEVNAIILGHRDVWREYITGFIVPVDEDVYRQAIIGKLVRELQPDYPPEAVAYLPRFGAWLPRDDPLPLHSLGVAGSGSATIPGPSCFSLLIGAIWLLMICGLVRRTATSMQSPGTTN